LGAESLKALKQIEVYNPDKTWKVTVDEE